MWTKVAEIADSMITQDLTDNANCWSQVLVWKIELNLPQFNSRAVMWMGMVVFAGTYSCFCNFLYLVI